MVKKFQAHIMVWYKINIYSRWISILFDIKLLINEIITNLNVLLIGMEIRVIN